MTSTRYRSAGGYSLLELMVALVVVGVLVSLAIPNFNDWNRRAKLRDAVSTLSWNLNLARMNAVNQNVNLIVTVCQQVALCPNPTANPSPAQVTVYFRTPAGTDVLPPVTMAAGVVLTNAVGGGVPAPQDVAFNPLGLRVATGSATAGNNLCVNPDGTYTGAACVNTDRQAFNFMFQATGYNYRVIVLPTGKVSWCTDAVFCQ